VAGGLFRRAAVRWVVVPGIAATGFAMWFAAPLKRAVQERVKPRQAVRGPRSDLTRSTLRSPGVILSRYRRSKAKPAWGCDPLVTIDDVRSFATSLPRTTEGLVRDRVKFRVGRIVYVAFSRDETVMGFGFPKEEREALVRSEPEKFMMPERSDLRYHWVQVRLDAIDVTEMRELVLDAWRMCVPKKVAAAYEEI
jgi:hypothetical protein